MQRKNIKSVLERISSGNFNADDEIMGKLWLHQLHQAKQSHYSDEQLEALSDDMWGVLVQANQQKHLKVRNLWPKIIAVAASIIIVISIFYFSDYFKKDIDNQLILVAPGKNSATLTLASGKKIKLDGNVQGKVAEESGISILKTASGQLIYQVKGSSTGFGGTNTLSTANGETYMLILPDQSKVWLNAASKLTYSVSLNRDAIRMVKLEGEAFFEVAKNKKHPFVVQTRAQEVEVLGTQFNLNSYNDEPNVATTLLEGSVLVKSPNGQQRISPGEQLINDGKLFKVEKVDLEAITDWKNGEFNLDGQPLQRAMREIARWYNLEIVFDKSLPNNIIAGGWISRKAKLITILEGIERSKQVHFKLEGRKLYVSNSHP